MPCWSSCGSPLVRACGPCQRIVVVCACVNTCVCLPACVRRWQRVVVSEHLCVRANERVCVCVCVQVVAAGATALRASPCSYRLVLER